MISILLACAQIKTPAKAPNKPSIEKNNYSYTREHLAWMIDREMRKHKISGVSVTLVAGQDIVWQQGFGYANRKTQEKVDQQTLFRTGSIAKLVNAIAVMQLVERGQLELDRSVNEYLPEFQPKTRSPLSKPITIRSLLTHQSGLPSDLIKGMWSSTPANFHSVLDYLNSTYVTRDIDTVFSYSNLGFDVIGAVIEKVSGKSYENYMNTLLKNLGMQSSAFSPTPHIPRTAVGYKKNKFEQELSIRDVPAAGLTSNGRDLAKLIMLFNNNGVLSKKNILQKKNIEHILDDYSSDKTLNFGKRVGLGLFYYDGIFYRGNSVVGHGGATVNHRALIKFSPKHKYGVILLSNSRNASASLHRIANKALVLMHEAKTGKPAPIQHSYWPQVSSQDHISDQDIIGHYATAAGLARIYRKGNKLYATIAGRKLRLHQRQAKGFYYLSYRFMGIFPINLGGLNNIGLAIRKVDNKEVLIGVNTLGLTVLLGEKILPTPIHTAWQQRIGKYRVVNPLEVINLPSGGLKIRDGFIIAYAKTEEGDKLEFVLQSQSNDQAVIAGIGRGLGETVFVVNPDGKEQLKYADLIFEKIE